MSDRYDYLALERVIHGWPAAEAIAEETAVRGAERVFLVLSRSLNQMTGIRGNVETALGKRYAGFFDGCREHTPRETVIACAAAIRKAEADIVVTVGGGTPLDTVKAAQIALAHDIRTPKGLDRYRVTLDKDGKPVLPAIDPSPVRQIAVPTTLSGAEFSNLAGVTDTERGIKDAYTARDICPVAVILDPAITRDTPDWLWLSTAIRSVDHAVETVCSTAPNVLADATALHALHLFADALPRNKADPGDMAARLEAQQAVWLATTGLNRVPYGASHGIGHQLGAVAGVPHGHCSCVMLPSVMRYNAPATETRQKAIAEALGDAGRPAADLVEALIGGLGLPTRLRDVGVTEEMLPVIAKGSLENMWVRANPRPLTTPDAVEEILIMAW